MSEREDHINPYLLKYFKLVLGAFRGGFEVRANYKHLQSIGFGS